MSKKVYVIEAKTEWEGSKWTSVPYVHIEKNDYKTVFEDKHDAEITLAEINMLLYLHGVIYVSYRIRKYKRCG